MGDTEGLNLAAKLVDGTTLYIPKMNRYDGVQHPDEPSGIEKNHPGYLLAGGDVVLSSTGLAVGNAAGLVNLNTATQGQLETLPGIGPVYAKAIITYRTRSPFQVIEEVQKVQGIGEKRYESIRDMITVH